MVQAPFDVSITIPDADPPPTSTTTPTPSTPRSPSHPSAAGPGGGDGDGGLASWSVPSSPSSVASHASSHATASAVAPALAVDEEEGPPVCRICLGGAEERDLGELTAPCECTGSLRFVHTQCLEKWTKTSPADVSMGRAFALFSVFGFLGVLLAGFRVRCELCRAHYRPRHIRRRFTIRVLSLVLFFLATVLSIVVPLRMAYRVVDQDYISVRVPQSSQMGAASWLQGPEGDDFAAVLAMHNSESLMTHADRRLCTIPRKLKLNGTVYLVRYCVDTSHMLPWHLPFYLGG